MRAIGRDERGFTLIEVIVAALILVIAFTALATVFVNGQSEASSTVQESQLINVADQQLEAIHAEVSSQGFDALSMNFAAEPQFTSGTPNAFVIGNCYEIVSNYDGTATAGPSAPVVTAPSSFTAWSACGSNQTAEPLQVTPGSSALIGPGSTTTSCAPAAQAPVLSSPCRATVGSLTSSATFTVYTYVTDTFVGCTTTGNVACPTTTGASPNLTVSGCSGAPTSSTGTFLTTSSSSVPCADARRVIIAVVPATNQTTAHEGRLTPVYLSAVFTNPTPSTNSSGSSTGVTLGLGL